MSKPWRDSSFERMRWAAWNRAGQQLPLGAIDSKDKEEKRKRWLPRGIGGKVIDERRKKCDGEIWRPGGKDTAAAEGQNFCF